MWDRLRVGAATLKHGASPPERPPERRGFFYGLSSQNNSFDSWHETSGSTGTYSYSIQAGIAPLRPSGSPLIFEDNDDDFLFAAPPPLQAPPRNPQRKFRPTSSVYSQAGYPDPQGPSAAAPRRFGQTDAAGISPPSSPDIPTSRNGHDPSDSAEISPIDEVGPDMSQLPQLTKPPSRGPGGARASPQPGQQPQQGSRTNIPLMRRERRKNNDATASNLREARSRDRLQGSPDERGEIRWNAVTGEPTTSATGRPAQVNPAEYAQGLGIRNTQSPTSSGPASAKGHSIFGERVRRLARPVTDKGGKFGFGGGNSGPAGGQRVASDTDPAAAAFESDKPEWRGASGRTALVAPVKDTKEVAPLIDIPRKSSKRMTPGGGGPRQGLGNRSPLTPVASPLGSETSTGSGPSAGIRQVVPSSQLQSAPIDAIDARLGGAQGQYPSPPPEDRDESEKVAGRNAPVSLPSQQNQPSASSGSGPQPVSQLEKALAIKRKPPPAHQNQHFGHAHDNSVTSVYSQDSNDGAAPRPPPHSAHPVTLNGPLDNWTQPQSRFSVTTYATSSKSSHNTPRESLDEFDHNITRPPLPNPPSELLSYNRDPPASVMDRKRPKMAGSGLEDSVYDSSSPVVISLKDTYNMSSPYGVKGAGGGHRKAVGSTPTNPSPSAIARARTNNNNSTSAAGVTASPSSRPASILSTATNTNKDLPPAPPETSAGAARDRVAMLDAQLSALGNRRINLTRSIKQMTELMPTDGLMATAEVLHKREVEKRKIEDLKTELADVQRQEYELGLKLHRAYKRLDRDAEWEGTALWVRRITG